jgi:hypothetical protein
VRSRTTRRFRKAFAELPSDIQVRARHAYAVFRENPRHPGLRFKQVHASRPIYSVRVALGCRALGVRDGDTIVWFWIGSHSDYDGLIS